MVEEAPSLAIADDPCPRRRHARVVLQRMLRMGKVGPGYHTDIANFARGAAAHERHQALEVAEALLRAGLLGEKPSVGQRHIYLNVRALPEIHALIDRGETDDPQLAEMWTAPRRPQDDAAIRPASRWSWTVILKGSRAGTVTVTTGTVRVSVTSCAGGEPPRAA